jgi:hypothetical protein
MKIQIVKLLADNPKGLRSRTISYTLGINFFHLLDLLDEMQTEGILCREAYVDFANAENYILWKVNS